MYGTLIAADDHPEVVGCYFDNRFEPALATMRLNWPSGDELLWQLPRNVMLLRPPPRQFGLRLQRIGVTRYTVCLVWDDCCLHWSDLAAEDLRGSDLARVLKTLKSDLEYMLHQPILDTSCHRLHGNRQSA